MRYLTFALGKGRLASTTLQLFEKIGITCEEMKDKESRKLIFVNEELKLSNTVLRILVLWEKIPFWRKGENSTRLWILDLENAECVCVVQNLPKSFWSTTS